MEVRRSKAIGVLANPARALRMLQEGPGRGGDPDGNGVGLEPCEGV